MAVSFGITKKILEHPSYNFGIALPFVAAFYVLNSHENITLPLLGYELGKELSNSLRIIGVFVVYSTYMLCFLVAGGLSSFVKDSKAYIIWPIAVIFLSIIILFKNDSSPVFAYVFGSMSLLYLAFCKNDDGYLSLLVITAFGGIFSLFSFVIGILWFGENYLFSDLVANFFGFSMIVDESKLIGSAMLITLGYSVYYAVFKTGEFWDDNPTPNQ